MPDIIICGRRLDQCSDMLPISMILPIGLYIGAIIPLAVSTYIPREVECFGKPGHTYYRFGITYLFSTFCTQLGVEVGAFVAGLRGSPLQTRKRWLAEWLLLGTYLINLLQLGGTIFGTYTLVTYPNIPCREDRALKPLVAVSWVLITLSFLYVLLCLQWTQEKQDGIQAWVTRLRCICSLCSCLGFATALEPLRKMDMDEDENAEGNQRETALVEHLAETFHIIFGNLSFTASDRHVGLVLATALQQKRRHTHIKQCLLENKDPLGSKDDKNRDAAKTGPLLEHCVTQKFPTVICPSNFARKVRPDMSAQQAADKYTGFSDRVPLEDLEEAIGFFEYAVAAYYVQDKGLIATDEAKEESKASDSSSPNNVGEAVAEPGNDADKPMGDDPPPRNDDLANQAAPTFMEHPDPVSDSMLAARFNGVVNLGPEDELEEKKPLDTIPERPSISTSEIDTSLASESSKTSPGSLTSPRPGQPQGSLARVQEHGHDEHSLSSAPLQEAPESQVREEDDDGNAADTETAASRERGGKRKPGKVHFRLHRKQATSDSDTEKDSGPSQVRGVSKHRRKSESDTERSPGTPDSRRRKSDSDSEVPSRRRLHVHMPPWVEGVSRSPDRTMKGQDVFRPTGRQASPVKGLRTPEYDSAGNEVTRVDVGSSRESSPLRNRIATAAEAVSERLHSFGQRIARHSPDKVASGGDVEMGHTETDRSKAGAAAPVAGMGKAAQKAMDGDMREKSKGKEGANKEGAKVKDKDGVKVIREDGEDKVRSRVCCSMLQTAEPETTPLDKLDCIYSRADNTILGTLPYMIALDWERRTIVLGVRGTSSMSDALTDAIAQPIPILPWLGDVITEPNGGIASVHSGILASAAALNHDLEDHGILSALLSGAAVDPEAKEQHTEPVAPQLDDALVAVLAETPAAAAFVDTHTIAAIPFSDTGTAASAALRDSLDIREPSRQSLEVKAGSLPSSAADQSSQANGHNTSPLQDSQPQRNDKASPFAQTVMQNQSPFAAYSTDRVESDNPLLLSGSEASRSGRSGSWLPAARAQSSFSPKELRDRDAEVMKTAQAAHRAEQQRNKEAYDLARMSPHARRRREQMGAGGVQAQRTRSVWMDRAASARKSFRMGRGGPRMSQSSRELELGPSELQRDLASEGGEAGQEQDGSMPGSVTKGETRLTERGRKGSGMLNEAGRKMKRFYEDTRASIDAGRHPDMQPTREGQQHAHPMDRRASAQLRRTESKRVRAQKQQEAREVKLRKQQLARQKKLEETMRKAEKEMQGTFMAKIFKTQADLRKLDSAPFDADEQAKRRSEYRAKQLKQLEERKLDCRGWQLVLTGHSLGAGVAALLALKLRPRYPNVPIKCWAYCPPGGLVTGGLAAAMAPFCTSVIVGKDAVPRASLGNLSRLVDEVVVGLARGRRCKARILLRNLSARGRAKCRNPKDYYAVENIPEECQEVLDLYSEGAEKRIEAIGQPTFPPGRIMYCRRLKESSTECSYDSVWVAPQDVMREGFIISSKMLKDHLCDAVTTALEMSIEKLKETDEKKPQAYARTSPANDSSDEDSVEE